MVIKTKSLLLAALAWAAGCHLATKADKYHVVEPGDGGADAGPGGAGGSYPCEGLGCNDCSLCAQAGPCAAEGNACALSQPCMAFQNCMYGCGTSMECWNMCANNHPDGAGPELTWIMCVECRACPGQCWVPQACP